MRKNLQKTLQNNKNEKNSLQINNQSQKILSAAYKCISERGYANVSLRDIADEANVVLSQLNYYFTNKEGLYREVLKLAINKYIRKIKVSMQIDTPIKDKPLHLIKYFQNVLKNDPALFKLLFDFSNLAMWSESFSSLLRNLLKEMGELIETSNFTINKKFKSISQKSLSKLLFGAILGTAAQFLLEDQNLGTAK